MLDVDMREFLVFMLRLPDGHARRLLRLHYVQEASIFVIPDLEEWVAVEEDVHAASVLRDALKALMSGDELGRALAANVATCGRCGERSVIAGRSAESLTCRNRGGPLLRPM